MRTYQVIEFDGQTVISYTENGIKRSFTTDPANSDYAEYLRYTEWVEAGNDPNEFWTQQSDFDTIGETIGETNENS